MTLLTGYMLRQTAAVTLFVTAALTLAPWLIQSLKLVELVVDHGVGIGAFLELAVLSLPQLLVYTLPIGCFIGVWFSYSKFLADSELIVMRACGLSQGRLALGGLILGLAACLVSYSITLYFEPASKNAFKNMQFDIRNQFTAGLLQEGSFNQLSDTLTVYVRARDPSGELHGLLIQDTRDPEHTVTLTAVDGLAIEVDGQPRVLMIDGTRQIWDRAKRQLSALSFDRWTLDLEQYRDAPGARWLQPDERFLSDLFAPTDVTDPVFRRRLWVEGHNRLASPLQCLAFVMVALTALLTGQHNRRGHPRRTVAAFSVVTIIEAAGVGLTTVADRHPWVVILLYLIALVPVAAASAILSQWPPVAERRPIAAVAT